MHLAVHPVYILIDLQEKMQVTKTVQSKFLVNLKTYLKINAVQDLSVKYAILMKMVKSISFPAAVRAL